MTKEEILWKHVSDLYAKEPAEIRKYSKEELEKTPEYQMMLQAMEEYKQQPAAPLSSLPKEWEEKLEEKAKDWGIYSNYGNGKTIARAFYEGGEWMLQQLQAENTRLREQQQAAQPPAAGEAVASLQAENQRLLGEVAWLKALNDEITESENDLGEKLEQVTRERDALQSQIQGGTE